MLDRILLLSLLALVCWAFQAIYRIYFHPLSKYPGPKVAAVSDSWWEFYWNYYRNGELLFEIDRLHKRHGPVIRVGVNTLHISDPEVYQDLVRTNSTFTKDPHFYLNISYPGTLIGETNPAKHRVRRKVLAPALSGSRVQELAPAILEKTKQLVKRFEEAADKKSPICITSAAKAFTMDIISKIVLGQELGCVTEPNFRNQLTEYLEAGFKIGWVGTSFPTISSIALKAASMTSYVLFPMPLFSFKQACLNITGRYLDTFNPHQAGSHLSNAARQLQKSYGERSAVIDMLMDPKAAKDHQVPSLEELNDELVMLLTAGNDTTSTALIYGLYQVYTRPAVYERIFHELVEEFPSLEEDISYERVRKLPFLTATIKEILRAGNPLPGRLPRTVPEEGYHLYGNYLKPGVNIQMSPYILNRHPDVWDKPNEFIPERWLTDDVVRLDRYLATFNKGARQCLGRELAWCEMWVVFGNIFRRFQITPYNTTDKDMEWRDLILVAYNSKFYATIEKNLT
ncbi:cytochrome P450 [Daldinia bambusicola]|nr:cytochrome P450 [Daldinia bambusicola]